MGHIIEDVARQRGHEIVCTIDKDTQDNFLSAAFAGADVAIEFSTPATAEQNIRRAWEQGLPVVCGTTGWGVDTFVQQEAKSLNTRALVWSSNFSLGVNLLFALNKRLAHLMRAYPQYSPSITEVHHIHKLDAPSGTAKTLRDEILRETGVPTEAETVPIESIREGEVAGIHTVRWESEEDILSLRHEAKSRRGFAVGAVIAAEWAVGKTGFHSMEEVLF